MRTHEKYGIARKTHFCGAIPYFLCDLTIATNIGYRLLLVLLVLPVLLVLLVLLARPVSLGVAHLNVKQSALTGIHGGEALRSDHAISSKETAGPPFR